MDRRGAVCRIPAGGIKPSIRPQLRKASAPCAARYYLFLSGHGLTVPFLLERWGGGFERLRGSVNGGVRGQSRMAWVRDWPRTVCISVTA